MSVRRRSWTNRDGSLSESWLVDYVDQRGRRHIKTFDRRKDADAYHAAVAMDVRRGTHLPDSESIMVAEAGKLWLRKWRQQWAGTIDARKLPPAP